MDQVRQATTCPLPRTGYAPACANEWRAGVCEKPRGKCSDCGNRWLIPVSDAVIYAHLACEKTIGVYPILPDDYCWFPAIDFDKGGWREDTIAPPLAEKAPGRGSQRIRR